METLPDQSSPLADAYAQLYGQAPEGVWSAPGRVNLIGEHTDYSDGFVMPFALAQSVTVAGDRRSEPRWRVTSQTVGATEDFGVDDLVPGRSGWSAYCAGVVWALREAGHEVGGADLVLGSDVPQGAGLSSSAALECGILTALVDLYGLDIPLLERARLAQRCENEFVGAPTGLMDQAASTLCQAEHALFFDCRSYDAEQVPLDLAAAGLELLVLDTRTEHEHVSSEYGARRRSCEEAAELLGVRALRDVTDSEDALARLSDPVMQRRVRHVVTENDRVRAAADCLRRRDVAALAPLLNASHASMRDDFEITVPTVDLAVETSRQAGAIGARMTGGGFGGCIIALAPVGSGLDIGRQVTEAFRQAGHLRPQYFLATPAAGARRIS